MRKGATIAQFYAGLPKDVRPIAMALRDTIGEQWPDLSVKLAWGAPCWSGRERIFSIMGHAKRCNLQLWQGARLAADYLGRIEGTGKSLRHVKVFSVDEIDDELVDIMDHAVRLDTISPHRVR